MIVNELPVLIFHKNDDSDNSLKRFSFASGTGEQKEFLFYLPFLDNIAAIQLRRLSSIK